MEAALKFYDKSSATAQLQKKYLVEGQKLKAFIHHQCLFDGLFHFFRFGQISEYSPHAKVNGKLLLCSSYTRVIMFVWVSIGVSCQTPTTQDIFLDLGIRYT